MGRFNTNERKGKKLFIADDKYFYNELFAAHRYVCIEMDAWSLNPMLPRELDSPGYDTARVCKQNEIIDCGAAARALVLERYQTVVRRPLYLFGQKVDWGAFPLFLALGNIHDGSVAIHHARLTRREWTGEWIIQTLGSESGNLELDEREMDKEFPSLIQGHMHQCLFTMDLDKAVSFCIRLMNDSLVETPPDWKLEDQKIGLRYLDLAVNQR